MAQREEEKFAYRKKTKKLTLIIFNTSDVK